MHRVIILILDLQMVFLSCGNFRPAIGDGPEKLKGFLDVSECK